MPFEPFLHTKLSTKFPDVGTRTGQGLMSLWLDHLTSMSTEELEGDATFRGCTFSPKGECAGHCFMHIFNRYSIRMNLKSYK